jgi:hypothetical protein
MSKEPKNKATPKKSKADALPTSTNLLGKGAAAAATYINTFGKMNKKNDMWDDQDDMF